MDEKETLLKLWDEIKIIVTVNDHDVVKNLNNQNKAAGVRARRGLRLLRKKIDELTRTMLDIDRAKFRIKNGDDKE